MEFILKIKWKFFFENKLIFSAYNHAAAIAADWVTISVEQSFEDEKLFF